MVTVEYNAGLRGKKITSKVKNSLLKKTKQPCVIDLCSGMGGISLAASRLGMRVVAGIDLNSDAIKTFSKNFPEAHPIEADVKSKKTIDECLLLRDQISGPLVVVSGPPCQGFSMAGPRNPLDARNRVLLDVARTVVKLKPHCALIENVSMVLAGKHNSLLTTLKRILRGGEYYVQNVLLDAADFGVPQRRKRAFFLISKNQIAKQDILNKLEKHKCPPQSVLAAFRGLPKPAVRPDDYNDSSDCKSIPNHFSMRHSKQVIDKINRLAPGTGPMSYRRLHPARPSNTLFSGHRAPPAHFSEPRSITVREAARLQGFPDSFRIYGSFGNQMTQVTNAVPPPLAQVVLRVLADVTGVPVT